MEQKAKLISKLLEFIIIQLEKDYNIHLDDVVKATINNDALYVETFDGEVEVIQFLGKNVK